uniref:F-actin-capping protein subunit alpha n=1 Tax=Anser brachyrhynchus TaxID=132585 RepID=A0A8B9C795_9AVES
LCYPEKQQGEPEKVSLICRLLHQSPPGEFGQVVQDLYALVKDDELVRQEATHAGAHHNKKNFTPVQVNGSTVLLTHYNDLGGNRFFYPQDKFSFEFDHLSGITSKTYLHSVMLDEEELWRGALHKGLNTYVNCYFPAGNCCVFKKSLDPAAASYAFAPIGFCCCFCKKNTFQLTLSLFVKSPSFSVCC